MISVSLLLLSLLANAPPPPAESCTQFYDGRIVSPEEVEERSVPSGAKPLWVLGWPCRALFGSMEKGLVKFERGRVREKIYDFQRKLAANGFRPLFGGLGEGSGIGVGTIYDLPHRVENAFHAMGRFAFLTGYQEFSANYDFEPLAGMSFNLVGDYQWRPDEPYYGEGQDSPSSDASSFALRQSSLSVHWDQRVHGRIHFGSIYNVVWLDALDSSGGARPSATVVFGELPGLGESTRLQSIGAYLGLDGFQGEYRLGGRGMFGASWQESFSEPSVRYAKLEGLMEGRLPVVEGRSVLIGQAGTDMVREASGTSPLPFYLYPRLGGSATLRGYPLDRFYGRNAIFTTLAYRWLLHPRIEAEIFLDSGQIFEHTDDLSLLDWHRNYGFGIRFRNETGTQFRLEMGYGAEGFSWHLTFGDRPIRPLGSGPVRYPAYRP
jgi:hypothetical protein